MFSPHMSTHVAEQSLHGTDVPFEMLFVKEEAEMESWLAAQSEAMAMTWEKAMERFYPQYLADWTDAASHLKAHETQWNTREAASYLDWDKYLCGDKLRILDLGAGTGWLSMMLSLRPDVETVYALDAGPHNLNVMLPELGALMPSDMSKIVPVLGLFTPILKGDDFFDAVVASSAVHHAPDLTECLREVHRVLKPGGWFLILNETPATSKAYLKLAAANLWLIARRVLRRRWEPMPVSVSAGGIVYDPYLGDRTYCDWQWKAAIESVGFSFQSVTTPYFSYKNREHQHARLTHFIARKA